MAKKYLYLIVFLVAQHGLIGQSNYEPTRENLEARKWFEEARFGMFIHWGVYSLLGDGEWVMNNQNIAIDAYEKLPTYFNPVDYDPAEWVRLAKAAGMKYITITSRHHDGFSMFQTKASDYNIVQRTPYKKDVLKLLADECHKEGIKLFFYYSLLDWHHDDYFPRGRTGNGIKGRAEKGDWQKYITFMKTQLTELLTNYGEIAGIWLDGHWDQVDWDGKRFGDLRINWHYDELYKLIHELQPECLIGNNHHLATIAGEDFQMFERDLPGHNTTGFGSSAEDVGSLPKEVCETINGSWGFNLQDKTHKTKKEIVHYLVKAAGYGSNLLLNVGPMPSGKIQKEHHDLLLKTGQWLAENGETIYRTGAGPITPSDDFAFTTKGKTMYLHILNPNKKVYFFNGLKHIKNIVFLKNQKKVNYTVVDEGLIVNLKGEELDKIDTILAITIE